MASVWGQGLGGCVGQGHMGGFGGNWKVRAHHGLTFPTHCEEWEQFGALGHFQASQRVSLGQVRGHRPLSGSPKSVRTLRTAWLRPAAGLGPDGDMGLQVRDGPPPRWGSRQQV